MSAPISRATPPTAPQNPASIIAHVEPNHERPRCVIFGSVG
jgi:hypothetical protein